MGKDQVLCLVHTMFTYDTNSHSTVITTFASEKNETKKEVYHYFKSLLCKKRNLIATECETLYLWADCHISTMPVQSCLIPGPVLVWTAG